MQLMISKLIPNFWIQNRQYLHDWKQGITLIFFSNKILFKNFNRKIRFHGLLYYTLISNAKILKIFFIFLINFYNTLKIKLKTP